jgi:uncharacterized membrane protein
MRLPILLVHVCAGILGLFFGTAALSFRKGSPGHVLAGKVFVASMLTMALGAAYLGIVKHQTNNIGGGIMTFYLIRNGVVDREAQRGGNEPYRLGCTAVSFGARYPHLDERY